MPRDSSRSSFITASSSAPTSASSWSTSSCSGGIAAATPRNRSASETSRCCAPSCRSRSMRRLVSSAVAAMRARDAVSAAWAWALAIAVAISSVNLPIWASVPRGKGASRLVDAAITPQIRPATTIGQPTEERIPTARASRAIAPVSCPKVSTRVGRPPSLTAVRCSRRPGRTASPPPTPPAPDSRRPHRLLTRQRRTVPCGPDRRRREGRPPA